MLKEIQYLRAVAVLMVVWIHAGFLAQATGAALRALHLGFLTGMPGFYGYFAEMAGVGVSLFFVISGYVVSATLFRSLILDDKARFIENLEANIPRLKAFFVRRFFRLFPVAALLIVVQTPGIWLWPSWFSSTNITEQLMGLLSHIGMQSDMDTIMFSAVGQHYRMVNHYWSLAVEERFYLIIPFLIIWCAAPRRFMQAACAIIFALFCVKAAWPLTASAAYLNGFLRFDAFLFGILVYLLEAHTGVMRALFTRRYSRLGMNLAALLLLLLLARLPIAQVTGPGPEDVLRSTQYYFVYSSIYLLSAMLVAMAAQDQSYVLAIPGLRRILEWIGDRSYIIYIFQFWFMFVAYKLAEIWHIGSERGMMISLLFIAVTAIGSEAIARLVEIPLRRYGKKLAGKIILSADRATP